MKKLEYEQGSEEWLKWRQGIITATDAACILGINPNKSAYQMWDEKKTGKRPYVTQRMQTGKDLEPLAVSYAEQLTGKIFMPVVVEHSDYKFFGASLDGLDFDDELVLEVKCSEKTFNEAKLGIIDPVYQCQIQHQLMCTELEDAFYVAYCPVQHIGIGIEVKRNDAFIQEMVEKETEFYYRYIIGDEEPPKSDRQYVPYEVDTFELNLIQEYLFLDESIRHQQERQKKVRKALQDLGDDGDMQFINTEGKPLLNMIRVNRQGIIDYEKLCLDEGISDAKKELYRKEQIGYYRMEKP